MKDPWLIQRGTFNDSYKKGIDGIISFDYMGSSEFEGNEMFQSLKRIREKLGEYKCKDIAVNGKQDKIITLFCKANESATDVVDIIEKLGKDDIRLKERIYFNNWVENNRNGWPTKFWLDILNDWMFWIKDEAFEVKFKERIKG